MKRVLAVVLVLPLAMLTVACQAQFEAREATISDIHQAIQARRITCVELVRQYLDRIEAYDKKGPVINDN